MPQALLIASNEICYNPRLVKTADCLLSRGFDVRVFNTVQGIASPELYSEFVASRRWQVKDEDISKRTLRSRLAWACCAFVSAAAWMAWRGTGMRAALPYALNRGLIGFPWKHEPFDVIVVNLVDNLPFAALLKRRHGGILIYDSQELFSGQSVDHGTPYLQWVDAAERNFIGEADVVLATTQALADRLRARFRLTQPVIRVRNAPLHALPLPNRADRSMGEPLRLVWHGFGIHLKGRGVDRLLEAIALCTQAVTLTLQGRLNADQRLLIEAACARLGIAEKVRFVAPAHPDHIVRSLLDYDLGVIAETGHDENQRLTSSNKLFEYIHAGLAVVAPDLPGLVETVAVEDVGLTYPSGHAADLARCIDRLARNREELAAYRTRAEEVAARTYWSADFEPVWQAIQDARTLSSADLAILSPVL